MKQRKQFLNSLGLSSPHLSQHLLRLLLLLVTAIGGVGSSWAEEETPGNTGTSNSELSGRSFSIDGTYIAGSGGTIITPMETKGVKIRTNRNSNTLVFSVKSGYKITGLTVHGISNDPEAKTAVTVSSASVDGGSNLLGSEIELPVNTSLTAGTISLTGINATNNITLTFGSESYTQAIIDIHVTYEEISGYTVTYNTNDGTQSEATSVTEQTALPTTFPIPTKDGYVFGGWYTDESCNTLAVKGTAISANITLYALWIAKGNTTNTLVEIPIGTTIKLVDYVPNTPSTVTAENVISNRGFEVANRVFANDYLKYQTSGGYNIKDAKTYEDGSIFTPVLDIKENRKLTFKLPANCKLTVYGNNPVSDTRTWNLLKGSETIISSRPADYFSCNITEKGTYTLLPTGSNVTLQLAAIKVSPITNTVTFNAGTNGNCTTGSLTQSAVGASIILPGVTPKYDNTFLGWSKNSAATVADAGLYSGAEYTPQDDETLYAVYRSGSNVIGDIHSGWWENFSRFDQLDVNKSQSYTFTVTGGDTSYKNWVLIATNNKVGHNGDGAQDTGGNELFCLRADGHYWGNKGGSQPETIYKFNNGSYETYTAIDANEFISAMQSGATVNLTVNRVGKKIYVYTTTECTNGAKYVQKYISGEISGEVYLSLTAQNAAMNFSATPTGDAYEVKCSDETNGTADILSAEGVSIKGFAVKSGTAVSFKATPDDGYKFVNWTGTDHAEVSKNNPYETTVSSALNLTPNFEAEAVSHTITFYQNGGTGTMDPQQVVDGVATVINTNTFNGADAATAFVGWNTAADGSGTDYAPGAEITLTEDIALYAQWFRFAPKGSQNDKKTIVVGGNVEGYVFIFRATKNLGLTNSDFEVSSSDVNIATATLRTVNETTETVSIDVNGVSVGEATITVHFKGKGGLYTERNATETFTIKNVSTPSDLHLNSTSQLATNNSRWTPKAGETLNIAELLQTTSTGGYTYQTDNTSVANVSADGVITAGSAAGTATITVTQAADATYAEGTLEIIVDIVANKSDVSSNAYTVANDDKVSNGTQIIRKDVTMTYGGENFWGIGAQDSHGSYISSLTNPVVSNNVPSAGTYYKFTATKSGTLSVNIKGNQNKVLSVSKNGTLIDYKDKDGKNVTVGAIFAEPYMDNVSFPVMANTDYYMYCTNSKLAVYGFEFLPNSTLSFDANGGTGTMEPLSVETGSDVAISHNTFTNSSSPYFTGWNTVADGSGTAYTDGDMIHVDGDITLYAQWSNKASRGVTLLSYTVNGAVTANTTYPADEGTVMFSKGSKLDGNGVYVKGTLPEGYKLKAGDKIIVTGSTGSGGDQGVFIANSTATPSASNAVSNIKNISQAEKNAQVSLIYEVTEEDVTSGKLQDLNSFYVFRYNSSWTLSSVKVIRDVAYNTTTSTPSDLSVTFDPTSGSILTEGKVKVLGNDNTDAMYIMWSSSTTATYDDICKAENLHQINPVYVEPTMSGNVYLYVVPANYNAGNPTRGAVQKANYKVYVDPVLTVSGMTTSAQIAGLTPNYAVTYNNGVEDVTVKNPAVTFTLKDGQATDVISISGTTISGLKEGKVVVVASYAGDNTLCLNQVTTEFTVNVDQHLYFKADFGEMKNYITTDKGGDPVDLPTFTIKDASGTMLTEGTHFTMSAYALQEGSDNIIDLSNKQVKTDRPGCAMVKITLTPIGSYEGTYETTNIYIPVMVEETDANKYYAVKNGDTFKLLDKIERNGCTMTFGGWAGYYEDGKTLDGTENGNGGNATYGSVGYHSNDDKKDDLGNITALTTDRWDNASGIASISTNFKYRTSGSNNKNPRNETATNPYSSTSSSTTHSYVRYDQELGGTTNAAYDLFSVPCRGAYVKFEPKYDGIVTLHINQKTILEDQNHSFANGRYFQIKDERGKFVMPRTYCSNTATIKTPRYADFKVGDDRLSETTLRNAIDNFQQEYELNQVLKIGSSVTEAPNFATLYECPVTYSFNAKAGKTYYAYCMVSKMDVMGFEFHTEDNNPSAINNVTLSEDGTINDEAPVVGTVISQASITYDRNITANNWNPIVLPYSMNEHQVKYVFGNGEDTWRGSAEILYFDHIDNATGTIVFMNHFYKTITAGVPCLVRPTKDVTSLSLAGCEYPYVTVETPKPMVVSAGEKGDGYNWSSAYTQQQILIGDYYFSATSGIKQKTSGAASTLKGFRGVLKASSPANARVYSVKVIDFEGLEEDAEATGLSYVIVDEEGNMSIPTANNIYNMHGQIVRANSSDTTGLPNGIYIVNNKKIYVK